MQVTYVLGNRFAIFLEMWQPFCLDLHTRKCLNLNDVNCLQDQAGNTNQQAIRVNVIDVQDTPPELISVSNTPIPEQTPAGAVVLELTARDGDSMVSDNVTYVRTHGMQIILSDT